MFGELHVRKVLVILMALATLSCDIYRLETINTVVTGYQKNGTMALGRNARDSSYVSEVLCNPLSITSIPSGSIITDAIIKYVVATNSIVTTTSGYVSVFEQNKASWTDTGSAPIYSTFASTAWSSLMITDTYLNTPISPTGNYTLISSSAFNSLVSGWVNGTGNAWGFIMSLNFSYFDSTVTINTVTIDVTYTPPTSLNKFFMYYKRKRTT